MSILLPHSDDELFILPFVESKIKEGLDVKIFFVTSDFNPKRDEESQRMLSQFRGVEVINIGRIHNIKDGHLSKKSQDVLILLEAHPLIKSATYLVCPTFEGGHVDHDATFKIAYKITSNSNQDLYTFSLYNAYQTFFVRVSTFFQGPVTGDKEVISFSFKEGFFYLKNIFYYKSQLLILTILFPGLFRTFLIKRKIDILKVKHFDEQLPHPGKLFYNNPWKSRIKSILRMT